MQLSEYNHNDSFANHKDHVLGHTVAEACILGPGRFTPSERAFLLELARWSLKISAARQELPEATSGNIPPALEEKRACFVTLMKGGKLRGCIGRLIVLEPIYRAVINNARNAAMRDPRFAPVEPDEVDAITIEISVLSEPRPLEFISPEDLLAKLEPGKHGVILQVGARTATFLPQVWTHVADKVEFLNHLAQKAGCESWEWRGPNVTVSVYEAESFQEGG